MKTAACTIISRNYLPYAKVLHASIRAHNPECDFYVLMVDTPHPSDQNQEFEIINVRSLDIPNFSSVAFRYNLLELNTNVKPTFLSKLLAERGIPKLLYFDPDILICDSLQPIFAMLDRCSILLTPHCTSPIEDRKRPSEQDFLSAGAFNLGFIGLRNSLETKSFLQWWEKRCLELGFQEPRTGLFVDQKWINLVPCFFDSVHVTRHPGCNMGYWNLHERSLTELHGKFLVNNTVPLLFFHFSGIDPLDQAQLSKHSNRHTLADRPDLAEIFCLYRTQLLRNEFEANKDCRYGYGFYSNGQPITQIARTAFAISQNSFPGDPFLSSGRFYEWANSRGLLGTEDTSSKYNSSSYVRSDIRVKTANAALGLVLKLLGSNRYTILMKYLSFISILRNQTGVLSPE